MGRRLLGTLAIVLAALVIPAAAGATAARGPRVRVAPGSIGPHTNVVIRFRQPVSTGALAGGRSSESVWLHPSSRPPRASCIVDAHVALVPSTAGTLVRRTLRPGRMRGGAWCLGSYRAVILLSQGPQCDPAPGHLCPMLMMAPRELAQFRFRVTPR